MKHSINKIGIVTFSSARNYGAVLQEYALCKYLNKRFFPSEVIFFSPQFAKQKYNLIDINKTSMASFVKSFIVSLLVFPFNFLKKKKFDAFVRNNIPTSSKHYINNIHTDDYIKYVVGSDQVWNMELTQNDTNFFLDFCNESKKKISYAASFGKDSFSEEQNDIIKRELMGFDIISVRESTGVSFVRKLLNDKKISQNIDPVFLLDKKIWETLASEPRIKSPYVLIYTFKHTQEAINLAKSFNKQIVVVGNSWIKSNNGAIYARSVGPKEFISLILHSDYVITDSFHGTAFSIIFHKDFSVYEYSGTQSRIDSLLAIFTLNSRIIRNDCISIEKIDYECIDSIIAMEQGKTTEYFESALRNIINTAGISER